MARAHADSPKFLFHFTRPRNVNSILKKGLSIVYDRRGKWRVWLAAMRKVMWARKHVALTHECTAAELCCITIRTRGLSLVRHRSGVYYSRRTIPATSIVAVSHPV